MSLVHALLCFLAIIALPLQPLGRGSRHELEMSHACWLREKKLAPALETQRPKRSSSGSGGKQLSGDPNKEIHYQDCLGFGLLAAVSSQTQTSFACYA